MIDQKLVERINTLIERHGELTAAAAAAELEAKNAKRSADAIVREELPELLMEAGMTELTTADGTKVELRQSVNASISELNRPAAHEWLVKNGFSGLIRSEVNVSFERGQSEVAQEFAAQAVEICSGEVALVDKVHPATLKAFVREQLEAGREVPMDLFGVFVFKEANIKQKRQTR